MIEITEAYKQASEETERNSYVEFEYGSFDENIKLGIKVTSLNEASFVSETKVIKNKENSEYNTYITCEPNLFKLNDSLCFIKSKNMTDESETFGYWNNELSNANNYFDSQPSIKLNFVASLYYKTYRMQNLLLTFEQLCTDFSIKWYYNTTLEKEIIVHDNKELNYYCEVSEEDKKIVINNLVITFNKASEPNRYVKLNRIDFGDKKFFTESQIVSYEIIEETSYDTTDIISNSLNLILKNDNNEFDMFNPNNRLSSIKKEEKLTGYHYLRVGTQYVKLPLGVFYLGEVKAYDNQIEFNAYSKLYFMNNIYYGSHFYANKPVSKIIEDFFAYYNFENYVIDEKVKDYQLTGYVRPNEFKEALRQIAEACCCVVRTNKEGKIELLKANSFNQYYEKDKPTLIYNKATKLYKPGIVESLNNTQNIFSKVNMNLYYFYAKDGDETVREEIYSSEITNAGQYILIFDSYPIDDSTISIKVYKNNTLVQTIDEDDTTTSGEYISSFNKYATSVIVNVAKKEKIKIVVYGLVLQEEIYTSIFDDSSETQTIDNPLISQVSSQFLHSDIEKWKNERREIKYNFSSLLAPYIEIGDLCKFITKYDEEKEFIPIKITISNGLKETIEGE